MVTDNFGVILKELAETLQIDALEPDKNNCCHIKFSDGTAVTLEPDKRGPWLVLGVELGDMPPGKYRENLFLEALKANDLPPPLNGILGYSKKSNKLILFEKLHIDNLKGSTIAEMITPFREKAKVWAEALSRGEVPILNQGYTSGARSSGMFGLSR